MGFYGYVGKGFLERGNRRGLSKRRCLVWTLGRRAVTGRWARGEILVPGKDVACFLIYSTPVRNKAFRDWILCVTCLILTSLGNQKPAFIYMNFELKYSVKECIPALCIALKGPVTCPRAPRGMICSHLGSLVLRCWPGRIVAGFQDFILSFSKFAL